MGQRDWRRHWDCQLWFPRASTLPPLRFHNFRRRSLLSYAPSHSPTHFSFLCICFVPPRSQALALVRRSFLGLCLAATLMGVSNAHGQLYRFAAVEFVPPAYQATAIAVVLSGGMVGAVVGPEYSKRTMNAVDGHPFVGCFLASMGIYALNLVIILCIRFPSGACRGRRICFIATSERRKIFHLSALVERILRGHLVVLCRESCQARCKRQ